MFSRGKANVCVQSSRQRDTSIGAHLIQNISIIAYSYYVYPLEKLTSYHPVLPLVVSSALKCIVSYKPTAKSKK